MACAALGLALFGCGQRKPPTVPRQFDGEIVHGPAFAPATYERFLEGELALARGDLEGARRAFSRASPGSDPVVLGRLAEVSARLGDDAGAARMLAEGEQSFPESEALAMARARIAELRGDAESAIAAYARATEIAPSSADAVLAAASALERASRPAEAVASLERFVAREPDRSPEAWWRYLTLLIETGGASEAVERATRALHRLAPRYDDQVRALAARALARHPEAAFQLLRPLPRSASDARTFLLALSAAKGKDRALAQLDRLGDPLVGGLLGRGQLLLELGRPAMAAALAEAVLEAQPEPSAFLLLGRAERARGRIPRALAALRRIPEATSAYVPAQIEVARSLAESGQGARARRVLLDLAPTYGEAWPEIGALLEDVSEAGAGDVSNRRRGR